MKSTLFPGCLLGVLLLLASPAQAQVSIGIKGGINVTSVSTDAGYNTGGVQNAFGLHLAALLEFALSDHFAVQPELNYIQKGYRVDIGTTNVNWIFNQVDIHLLAKYNYSISDRFKGYVNAGPTFGPVLDAYKKPDNGDKVVLDFDKDLIKKWDYGITGGLGFGIVAGEGLLFIDGRYMLSLDDIFEESANKGKFRRVGFDYTIGYLVPF